MTPILAVVDIDVHANMDETARLQLQENIQRYDGNAVTPLWINWLRARADLRLACLVNELETLDDFLVDHIRTVPGVRGTSAFLVMDGIVRDDIVEVIPPQDSVWTRRAAATVMIRSEPGRDREVYKALTELPLHNQTDVIYVARLFHCHACDLMVMLMGERTASLTGYVMSWIRTIPGVSDTEVVSILDWKVLAKTEDLIQLAQCFPVKTRTSESLG